MSSAYLNQCLDGTAKIMYGCKPAIFFIWEHLPLSSFSWKLYRVIIVYAALDFIQEILLNIRRRDFFILKKKGSFERILTKNKMMVTFFTVACQQCSQMFHGSSIAELAFLPQDNQPTFRNYLRDGSCWVPMGRGTAVLSQLL